MQWWPLKVLSSEAIIYNNPQGHLVADFGTEIAEILDLEGTY